MTYGNFPVQQDLVGWMHLMVDFEGRSVQVLTHAKKGPYVGGTVKSFKQLQDYSNHSAFTKILVKSFPKFSYS